MKLELVYVGNPFLSPFYILRRREGFPVGGAGSAEEVQNWLESDKVDPLRDDFDFTAVEILYLTGRDVRVSDRVVFMDENDPTEQTPDILTSRSDSRHPFDSILEILRRVERSTKLTKLVVSGISTNHSGAVMPSDVLEKIVQLVGGVEELTLEGYSVLPEGVQHFAKLTSLRDLDVKDLLDLDFCIDSDTAGSGYDEFDIYELMMDPGGEYPGAEGGLVRPPCHYKEGEEGVGIDLWVGGWEEASSKRCIRPYTQCLLDLVGHMRTTNDGRGRLRVDLYSEDRGATTRKLCVDGWAFEVLIMEGGVDMGGDDEEIKYGY